MKLKDKPFIHNGKIVTEIENDLAKYLVESMQGDGFYKVNCLSDV